MILNNSNRIEQLL